MSVLIKMKMPKNCYDCELIDIIENCPHYELPNEAFCQIPWLRKRRHENCPIIEVPTPHGRLIDADALRLLYDFNGYKPTGDMAEEEFDRLMCRLPVIRANIDDMPTIIPAEEET